LIKIAKLAIEKIEELTGSKKQEILSQVLSKRTNQVIVLLLNIQLRKSDHLILSVDSAGENNIVWRGNIITENQWRLGMVWAVL
jgi:hypothetical protein